MNYFRLSSKVFFSATLVVMLASLWGVYLLYTKNDVPTSYSLLIKKGTTLTHVVGDLHDHKVIRHPWLFKWLLRLTYGSRKVRAGEFRFEGRLSEFDCLSILYHGEPVLYQVTIPEGYTIRQIAQVLGQASLVDEKRFIDLTVSTKEIEKYHLRSPSLEGFLFPDTYSFSRVDGEDKIVERMVSRFFEKWTAALMDEMNKKGWSLEALVTLASIIEKETGIGTERQLVSSVFHNRLLKKMRLQSDPTTIYGITGFNGNLTKADLLRYTPYNTYVINGLPPGPIANPGLDSLLAALRPTRTNYLYFVSNKKGGHIFSNTYAEHNRHVDYYQKRSVLNVK